MFAGHIHISTFIFHSSLPPIDFPGQADNFVFVFVITLVFVCWTYLYFYFDFPLQSPSHSFCLPNWQLYPLNICICNQIGIYTFMEPVESELTHWTWLSTIEFDIHSKEIFYNKSISNNFSMTFLQKIIAFIIKYWQRKKQCSFVGLAANSSDSKQ